MTTATMPQTPASIESFDAASASPARSRRVLWCILGVCAVGVVLAAFSDGGYMDDDVTHYLISRTAWERPELWLDEWGRPGFTIPYGVVAWIGSTSAGFMAARLFSVALLGATAWLTYQVALGLGMRFAGSAAWLLAAMPLVFFTSYTTTTETIAAFYTITATYLLLGGHRWMGAAVLALLPLTRHELAVFLIPIGLYWLWRRDVLAAALLLWAEGAWNLLTGVMSLYPPHGRLPIARYFVTADAGLLGYGYPWHYLLRWMEMCGVVMVALSATGALLLLGQSFRQPAGTQPASPLQRLFIAVSTRQRRIGLLIGGGALGMLLLQTWLYMVNTHLSGGYARFLIPAAPWMAICAAAGIAPLVRMWHEDRLNGPARAILILMAAAATISLFPGREPRVSDLTLVGLVVGALAAIAWPRRWVIRSACGWAAVVMACQWQGHVQPHRLTADQHLIRRTLAELRQDYPDYHITGSSPWIQYFLSQPVNLPRWHDPLPWDPQKHPVHTLYVHDPIHAKPWVLAAMADVPHRRIGERSHDQGDGLRLDIYERLE